MKPILQVALVGILASFSVAACGSGSGAGSQEKDVAVEMDVGADAEQNVETDVDESEAGVELRVATFNASMFRPKAGELLAELEAGTSAQIKAVAKIVQTVRPDVLLVNEFDYDASGKSADAFRAKFLAVSQGEGLEGIEYPYAYVAPSNTGVHSGFDLNQKDGVVSEPGTQSYGDDAFGFGTFEGQYSFVILSKYPLKPEESRSFQKFLWSDMPDNLLPTDWYSEDIRGGFRLSSKNHVDMPVDVDGHTVHILAAHPTPPAFDGAEQRNVRRNNDEVRLWLDYIATDASKSAYIKDDAGKSGGLAVDAKFVIVGDLNTDPVDSSVFGAATKLVASERVTDPLPASEGAVEKGAKDGMMNTKHKGDPKLDTADFSDGRVGNLRVDYALPSSNMEVVGSGVFWPKLDSVEYEWTRASDHHLVWVDLEIK